MSSKFSAAIKAGLALQGIGQATLAKKIKVSENTVSRWVVDSCLPDKESLSALKEFFSWDQSKLLYLLEDWYENHDFGPKYRIAGSEYVRSRYDNDYIEFLSDLIKLDYSTVGRLNDNNEGTPEQWGPIFRSFPDTWKLVLWNGEIVGYWNFVFLKEEYFWRFHSGELSDSDLEPEKMDLAVLPGDYFGYFVMFTIEESHQRSRAFDTLIKSFSDIVEDLTKSDRYFKAISAHAYTPLGAKLCNALGMSPDGVFQDDYAGEVPRFLLNGKDIKNSYLAKKSAAGVKYRERFG
jgi:transcriptional regulator with XRE-family HTH domain